MRVGNWQYHISGYLANPPLLVEIGIIVEDTVLRALISFDSYFIERSFWRTIDNRRVLVNEEDCLIDGNNWDLLRMIERSPQALNTRRSCNRTEKSFRT